MLLTRWPLLFGMIVAEAGCSLLVSDLPDPIDTGPSVGPAGESGRAGTLGLGDGGEVVTDGGARGDGVAGSEAARGGAETTGGSVEPGSGASGEPPASDGGGDGGSGGLTGNPKGGTGGMGGTDDVGGIPGSGGSVVSGGGSDGSDETGGSKGMGKAGKGGKGGNGDEGGASGSTTGGSSGTGAAGAPAGAGGSAGTAVDCDVDRDTSLAKGGSCGGDDCDDADPDVHPGQLTFFTTPSPTQGFDYDCNGQSERQFTSAIDCAVLSTSCSGEGFSPSAPVCGEVGTWVRCSSSAAPLPVLCSEDALGTRAMACR